MLRQAKRSVDLIVFYRAGRKPWTRGYDEYKRRMIRRILEEKRFSSTHLESGYGFRVDERVVEYPWLFSRLPDGNGRMLDAGSALNHEFILATNKLRSKALFISTLAPESVSYWRRGISYVYEDLRYSSYRDDFFDWIACISTLEHVGMDNTALYTSDDMKRENDPSSHLRVVRECHRMLKPSGRLFLSVPFGAKKDHGWFQVFDGQMVDEVIAAFSPSACSESHFRYLSTGWQVSSREESRESTSFDIHACNRYDPDFAAADRAIVCIEMTK
jgi:SAM-dependent methyltransferase